MADAQVVAQGNGVSTREAVLAEMAKAPAPEPVAEEPSQSAAESTATPSEEEAQAAPVEETDADEEVEAGKVEAKPDADTDKRLATVKAQEKRLRDQLAKDRAEAASEIKETQRRIEAEWGPKVKAAQDFEALKARARRDPAAVLQALGLTDDDMMPAAQQLAALSKEGQTDPKRRVHAEQLLKEREREDKLSATEKRIAELEQKLTARDQETAAQAEAVRFMATVTKAVSEESPLVAKMMAKNPARAEAALARIAVGLLESTGEEPDPSDVIAALEKQRRDELDELGIEYTAPAKKEAADTKRPGKTLGAPAGKTSVKVEAKDRKEERDEVLRELSKLSPTND